MRLVVDVWHLKDVDDLGYRGTPADILSCNITPDQIMFAGHIAHSLLFMAGWSANNTCSQWRIVASNQEIAKIVPNFGRYESIDIDKDGQYIIHTGIHSK